MAAETDTADDVSRHYSSAGGHVGIFYARDEGSWLRVWPAGSNRSLCVIIRHDMQQAKRVCSLIVRGHEHGKLTNAEWRFVSDGWPSTSLIDAGAAMFLFKVIDFETRLKMKPLEWLLA